MWAKCGKGGKGLGERKGGMEETTANARTFNPQRNACIRTLPETTRMPKHTDAHGTNIPFTHPSQTCFQKLDARLYLRLPLCGYLTACDHTSHRCAIQHTQQLHTSVLFSRFGNSTARRQVYTSIMRLLSLKLCQGMTLELAHIGNSNRTSISSPDISSIACFVMHLQAFALICREKRVSWAVVA